jgi:hypothetical protein
MIAADCYAFRRESNRRLWCSVSWMLSQVPSRLQFRKSVQTVSHGGNSFGSIRHAHSLLAFRQIMRSPNPT